jgi:prolyl-tRNA editing enzyme YbaK/EbsC (Cys-tRNA(Pro) deacylase)
MPGVTPGISFFILACFFVASPPFSYILCDMQFGTLEFGLAGERLDLLASATMAAIQKSEAGDDILVAEIDSALSDTKAFCEKYGIGMDKAANCVVIEATRRDKRTLAVCVVLATTRADINGIVRKFLDARRASFAPMQEAVEKTGMEFGGITPVGLPADWPILIDARVTASERVIIGSGVRTSKLLVSGPFLASLPNATVIENLAK